MLRIGPAGWAYKDWKGIVYPAGLKNADQLVFLARYFDVIEINTSFYNPIASSTAQSWCRSIEANTSFRFTAKIWRELTHARHSGRQHDAVIRESFAPLVEAKRLGALLLQFPSSFHYSEENRDYVASLRDRFRDFPLVLEVRHTSWNEIGVLDFLFNLEIGLCNIDQPLFRKSIAPAALTTSPLGYVRLHGRNYKNWWVKNQHAGARYDYLYSPQELDPWVDRIQLIDKTANDTYVITNNHFVGKAVANAVELIAIITGQPVDAPASLIERYPELADFTSKPEDEQLGLGF